MEDAQLIEWLMRNGGPIVRWRTATELQVGTPPSELNALTRELLTVPLVPEALSRLTVGDLAARLDDLDASALGRLGSRVHGSKAACLENVFGKLAEYGLRAGMPALDERALPLMRLFRWRSERADDVVYGNAWETMVKSVFAWGLLRLGYTPDRPMAAFLHDHLGMCYRIARDRVYDIYAAPEELVGLPQAWAGKPILKQEVMRRYWLPYIHDLYVFAHWPPSLRNPAAAQMIDELLAYILDPRFQALREGYGYAWIKERRACYGWGWSPHLPGYGGFADLQKSAATPLLARVELLARLPRGRRSPWFESALDHLEKFRAPDGTYCFPGPYIREAEGYYVSGYGMGLGENRRKSLALEIESTFRMLLIRKIGGAGGLEDEFQHGDAEVYTEKNQGS